MPDITLILIGVLVLAVLWLVVKTIFKLTMKIFSCGCILILIIGAIIFFSSYFSFF